MSSLVLGGDVNTEFKFGKLEDYAASIEVARLEQEMMVGYPLVLKGARQTHMQDDKGRDVYEVFATFAPAGPLENAPINEVGSDG